MMRTWNNDYWLYLINQFRALTKDLKSKLDQVVAGRVVPSTANIPLNSGRKVSAAVLFFDIKDSSKREEAVALYTLATLIPTVMRIVHDHEGYVEKNTGDGVMAIFTAMDNQVVCRAALQTAMACFTAMKELVNPQMAQIGIPPVEARIGIDFGELLVARIGVHQGSAQQDRSFLTAIGAAANIACRLQEQAGTNEIWVGNLVKHHAPPEWQWAFKPATPQNWSWVCKGTRIPYPAWHFDNSLSVPNALHERLFGFGAPARPSPPQTLQPLFQPEQKASQYLTSILSTLAKKQFP